MPTTGQPEAPNDPSILPAPIQVLEQGDKTSLIIETNRSFDVAMGFTLAGSMATGLVAAPLTFTIRYYYDQLDVAAKGLLTTVTHNTQPGQFVYNEATPTGSTTTAPVPAGKLAVGIYRLEAVVNFTIGTASQEIYAFTDGPVIEIVNP